MSAEQILQRRLTRDFINRRPIDIVVDRSVKVGTPRGGYTLNSSSLNEQRVTIAEMTEEKISDLASDLGLSPMREHKLLVAQFDADLEYQDQFDANGTRWQVMWVDHNNALYETRAIIEAVR